MEMLFDVAQKFTEVTAPMSVILCGITAVLVGWLVYSELPE